MYAARAREPVAVGREADRGGAAASGRDFAAVGVGAGAVACVCGGVVVRT